MVGIKHITAEIKGETETLTNLYLTESVERRDLHTIRRDSIPQPQNWGGGRERERDRSKRWEWRGRSDLSTPPFFFFFFFKSRRFGPHAFWFSVFIAARTRLFGRWIYRITPGFGDYFRANAPAFWDAFLPVTPRFRQGRWTRIYMRLAWANGLFVLPKLNFRLKWILSHT